MYPSNAAYCGPVDIAEWADVYSAMCNLLHKDFVKQGILNSYSGVIVDEYQDCTAQMHAVIVELKRLLPCRVLGDDLQGIFGFRDEKLIDWSDVRAEFASDLGALETPIAGSRPATKGSAAGFWIHAPIFVRTASRPIATRLSNT